MRVSKLTGLFILLEAILVVCSWMSRTLYTPCSKSMYPEDESNISFLQELALILYRMSHNHARMLNRSKAMDWQTSVVQVEISLG